MDPETKIVTTPKPDAEPDLDRVVAFRVTFIESNEPEEEGHAHPPHPSGDGTRPISFLPDSDDDGGGGGADKKAKPRQVDETGNFVFLRNADTVSVMRTLFTCLPNERDNPFAKYEERHGTHPQTASAFPRPLTHYEASARIAPTAPPPRTHKDHKTEEDLPHQQAREVAEEESAASERAPSKRRYSSDEDEGESSGKQALKKRKTVSFETDAEGGGVSSGDEGNHSEDEQGADPKGKRPVKKMPGMSHNGIKIGRPPTISSYQLSLLKARIIELDRVGKKISTQEAQEICGSASSRRVKQAIADLSKEIRNDTINDPFTFF